MFETIVIIWLSILTIGLIAFVLHLLKPRLNFHWIEFTRRGIWCMEGNDGWSMGKCIFTWPWYKEK